VVAAALLTITVSATALRAQASLGELGRQATRAELEKAATASESAASGAPDAKTRELLLAQASAIRQRLRNGDFVPGDRILLQVVGDTVLSDTFTVRSERIIQLPSLPEVHLAGVLDSELETYLLKELSKYIRNVDVTATPLVRVYLGGAFGRPGFVTVPVDQALTDLVNTGTPSSGADLPKAVVRRSGKTFMDRRALQDALTKGKTLGDVSMRDGDELYVPATVTTPGMNWQQWVGVVGSLAGVYWMIRFGFRGRP
jgi:hypothetical protein